LLLHGHAAKPCVVTHVEGLANNITLVVNLKAPSIQEEGEEQNPQV
jgi:hypothetical protein